MTDFPALLAALSKSQVEFIIIGGLAGAAHGLARVTFDLDVVYRRSVENMSRLVAAIESLNPYPRGAPPGLPFKWDTKTLQAGLNFTLTTNLGQLDLLGEITLGGDYEALLPHTEELDLYGFKYRCLNLKRLIEVKVAVGRPKDFEMISQLRALLITRRSQPD
jgi:hypothetical protein